MRKKILLIVLSAGAAVGLWWWNRRSPMNYAGTLEATVVDVAARLPAPLAEVMAREGDVVRAGQPLALLDGADLKLEADMAERDYQRGLTLRKKGSLPEEALERLRFRRDESALRLSWCTLTSPLNGTVLLRYREPGEWVTPGQKILSVADLSSPYVVVYVPAPMMATLALGEKVKAYSPDLDLWREGTITHVRSEAEFTPKNVQTRTERERLVFGIKIRFDNGDQKLKPGLSLEVSFPSPQP